MEDEPKREILGALSEGEGYVEFTVYVKPSQGEERLVVEGGDLVLFTPEAEVSDRAKAALRRLLLTALKVHHGGLKVEEAGRGFRVRVRGLEAAEVAERLASAVREG